MSLTHRHDDYSNMDGVLAVTCQDCGRQFASVLAMNRETFEGIRVLRNHRELCPYCGRTSLYEKSDYFFFPSSG